MSGLDEMIGLKEPSLSLDRLADVVQLDRNEVRRWIKCGWFRPSVLSREPSREFTLEDAVVLTAAARLIEMGITAAAALMHANAVRGWKPGQRLVVAPERLAVELETTEFSSWHAASKTYGGIMSTKDINSWIAVLAEVRMTNFDGLVIGSLDRLEDELRFTLDNAD